MKKIILFSGLLSFFLLISCFGDDDDRQPNPQSINLIGTWEVKRISNTDILGCEDGAPMTIEFKDGNKVAIKSFFAGNIDTNLSTCEIQVSFCKSIVGVDNDPNDDPNKIDGDYSLNNNSGMIMFNEMTQDGSDDFIPPPNLFNYRLDGNTLTIETIDPCLQTPIVYTFEKN